MLAKSVKTQTYYLVFKVTRIYMDDLNVARETIDLAQLTSVNTFCLL